MAVSGELLLLLTPDDVSDSVPSDHAFEVDDGAGRKSMLCLWNHPGDDITGVLARTEKVRRAYNNNNNNNNTPPPPR